jgi:phage tail-like protein
MAERNNPYGVFNFKVDFDNGVSATFSEITGLDNETEVFRYRTGADSPVQRPIPGLQKFPNIVMKRGIIGTTKLWDWRKQVIDGIGDNDTEGRTTVTIHLLNEKRAVVASWVVTNAFPVKWSGPALNASKTETALETLELAHEGITMTAA